MLPQVRTYRQRDLIQWLTVQSTLDVEIPPYSFVGILDVDRQGIVYVGYPQEDGDKLVLVTDMVAIRAKATTEAGTAYGTGRATNDFPWWVEASTQIGGVDLPSDAYSRGRSWGPKANSFKAHVDKDSGTGFLLIPMKDDADPPYSDDHKLVYLGLEWCRP